MFRNWGRICIFHISLFIFSLAAFQAYAISPGHQRIDAPVISPSDALKILSGQASSGINVEVKGMEEAKGEVAPEIKALARELKHNVDLIYQFVHDHIDYTPIFGAIKGPKGTLLDKCGNDFDQAALMVALLRESGYEAGYIFGQIRLSPNQVRTWLGIDPNGGGLGQLLGSAGIPGIPYVYSDGSLAYLIMSHLWVTVNIDGVDYVFDPSFKEHAIKNGLNLVSVTGYDQASFISQALSGATTGSDYIQDVNKSALSSALSSYSQNLIQYIRTNMPAATLQDVIGGKKIMPLPYNEHLRQTSLPYQESIDAQWTEIPDSYRTSIRIQHVGIDQTFFTDEIYGARLTIFYNSSVQPELRLDGQLIVAGNSVAQDSYQDIIISVDHPYAAFSGTYCDDTRTFQIQAGGSYLIVNGWAETTRGMVERHRRLLKEAMYSNNDPGAEPVLGESLAMIAYTWLAECSRSDELMDRLAGTFTIHHHMLGVCGQNQSPYIDMPMCLVSVVSEDADQDKASAAFFVSSGHHSAFEWGVIDQLQPFSAVSTVKLLDIANNESDKLFDADSSNFSTISPQLNNYSSYELSNVQMYINAGYRVLLPENGDLGEGEWSGIGFLTISPDEQQIGHIIAGGLHGGYGTSHESTDADSASSSGSEGDTSNDNKQSPEPIDLVTGAYLYNHSDISIGNGKTPFSLGFKRHYNSDAGFDMGPLGLGWVHNLGLSAREDSDGFQGMGEDSPVDAASAIVESMVSIDILTGNKDAESVIIATLSHKWFMDQLIHNIVKVSEPGMTSKFLKLSNGTFNPPQGVASSLIPRDSGGYILKNKANETLEFGADGNILSWTDLNGNAIVFSYSNGRLTSISNGMGRSFSITYNSDGLISRISDQGGRHVDFTYDEQGHLTTVTDPDGHTTRYEYDSAGRILAIYYPSHPDSPYVANTYDDMGRIATQADANGNTYTYFISGFRAEEVDPLGNSNISYFNRSGSTCLEIDQTGNVTAYEYDGQKRVIRKTFPAGNYIQFAYDPNHNVTQIALHPKPGFPDSPITESFTYDLAFNKPLSHTDPQGRVTTFEYDSKGNLTRIARPAVDGTNPVTTFTYNARGQVLSMTDPEGMVTAYAYDAATGDLFSVARDHEGLDITRTFSHDQYGNIIQSTDPLGRITSYLYNNIRKVIRITDPLNQETRFTYDADGRLVKIEQETGDSEWPWQTTSMTYTPSGQLASVTDPEGHITGYEYDALDRKWKTIDPLGRVTEILYDAVGRKWKVINPLGNTEQEITYSANGRPLSIKDANGNTTTYEYDGFDRRIKAVYPDGSFEQFSFDPSSNLTQKITRSGQVITFSYDALNRLTLKTVPGPSSIQYEYDLSGRLVQLTDEHGTTYFDFDSAGRLSQVTYPGTKTVQYQYDLVGNRTQLTYPDGYFVTYQYDNLDRLTQILESGTTSLASYSYDSLSRRTSLTYGNGVSTDFTFEQDNDVSRIVHTLSGDAVVQFDYTYNDAGSRTTFSVNDDRFVFNPSAEIEEQYVVNVLNQYTSVAGVAFSYDGNGNLASDGLSTYSYDAENRLVTAVTSSHSLSFSYDGFGRRIEKDTDGQKTSFLYDKDHVLVEYDGAGQELRRFVYGPGIDQPVCMISGAEHYYYLFNALGSVVALSDNSASLVETYSYSPYGIPSNVSSVGNPYYYTGRRYDAETGLYYYRARYYNPGLGRFLQVDPIGYAGGMNLYAYVENDPVDWVDKDGCVPTLVTGAIGAAGGAIVGGVSYFISHSGEWSWSQFWGSVAGGAVSGGIAGLTMGASLVMTTGGAIVVGSGSAALGYATDFFTSGFITRTWGESRVGKAKEWSTADFIGNIIVGGVVGLFWPSHISHVRGAWPKYLKTWLKGSHGKAIFTDWLSSFIPGLSYEFGKLLGNAALNAQILK